MSKQKKSDPEQTPESVSEDSDSEQAEAKSEPSNPTEDAASAAPGKDEPSCAPLDDLDGEETKEAALEPAEIELLKAEVNELTSKVIELESELSDAKREVSYAKAETQTVTRRGREDTTRAVNRAKRDLLTRLMLVADTFQQTSTELEKVEKDDQTDVIVTAVQMAIKEFDKVLIGEGLELMNPVGEPFDPQFHEAQAIVPSEAEEPGTIIDVLRVGYLLDGNVLRAPQVVVAKEIQSSANESTDES